MDHRTDQGQRSNDQGLRYIDSKSALVLARSGARILRLLGRRQVLARCRVRNRNEVRLRRRQALCVRLHFQGPDRALHFLHQPMLDHIM